MLAHCWSRVTASFMPTVTPASDNLYQTDPKTGVAKLVEVACWAHARRYLYEVHVETSSPAARQALDLIAQLFRASKADIRGRSPAHAATPVKPTHCDSGGVETISRYRRSPRSAARVRSPRLSATQLTLDRLDALQPKMAVLK